MDKWRNRDGKEGEKIGRECTNSKSRAVSQRNGRDETLLCFTIYQGAWCMLDVASWMLNRASLILDVASWMLNAGNANRGRVVSCLLNRLLARRAGQMVHQSRQVIGQKAADSGKGEMTVNSNCYVMCILMPHLLPLCYFLSSHVHPAHLSLSPSFLSLHLLLSRLLYPLVKLNATADTSPNCNLANSPTFFYTRHILILFLSINALALSMLEGELM